MKILFFYVNQAGNMNNYYFLSGKNSSKVASASAPEGTKLAHDLISELENVKELPFELNLTRVTVGENNLVESYDLSDLKELWLDYLPNSLAWPLMSEKLKYVIEKKLTGTEGIDWISVIVNGAGERQMYYVPRFSKMLDVLDSQKTLFVQGTDRIIRPVFSRSKIDKYSVFHQPSAHGLWKITSGLYVDEVLKKAIQKEKLAGIDFERTSVA